MSLIHIEGLQLFGIEPPEEDAILEYHDVGLELSNTRRAEALSNLIRNEIGFYRHGPMWAEWCGMLPDGRTIWLQASDRTLVITFSSTDDSWGQDIHAGWDRKDNTIYSLDVRNPAKNNPEVSYQKNMPREYEPETLTPWHISHHFAEILGRTEKAVEESRENIILSPPKTR